MPLMLPNIITMCRLLAVPGLIWLILTGRYSVAVWVFVLAGASDALDGFLAKRFNARTALGAFLDPLADKALLVAVYLALGYQGFFESWLVILVVFRDVLIVGGALLFYTMKMAASTNPLLISKVNTVLQILLAAWVLALLGLGMQDHGVRQVLVYAVSFTTLLSGIAYVVMWTHKAAGMENQV